VWTLQLLQLRVGCHMCSQEPTLALEDQQEVEESEDIQAQPASAGSEPSTVTARGKAKAKAQPKKKAAPELSKSAKRSCESGPWPHICKEPP